MGPGWRQEALGLWRLGWVLGTRAGAEAVRAGGQCGVGGNGSGICPLVREPWGGALDQLWAVVGLITPTLRLHSRGQNKDKPHHKHLRNIKHHVA